MENDSIRAIGSNTLVDIWIDGKLRAISVTNEAIGAYLGFDRASGMSESDRCEFVRTNLPLLMTSAKTALVQGDPTADTVLIDVGQLPRADGRVGDRRRTDRRQSDRRKSARTKGDQPERRRSERRTGERRRRPPKPNES